MFKKLSLKITRLLTKKNIVSESNFEIFSAAAEAVLLWTVFFAAALVLSLIFGCFLETVLFLIGYLALHKFAGGIHFKRQEITLLICIILQAVFAAFIKAVPLELASWLMIVSAAGATVIVHIYAPVDHEDKRLSSKEKEDYRFIARMITLVDMGLSFFVFVVLGEVTELNLFCLNFGLLSASVSLLLGYFSNNTDK